MRVLFAARSASTHANSGGMEQGYEEVASYLIDEGFDVALLTTEMPTIDGLPSYQEIWELPTPTPGRYSAAWWRQTASQDAPWVAWAPDVVFSVSRAGARVRTPNAPTIGQCHGTALAEVMSSLNTRTIRELAKIPLNIARIFPEVRFYRRARLTIAVGKGVEDQLRTFPFSLASDRVTTIPNGVDVPSLEFDEAARNDLRGQLGIDPSSSVAITTSRLHRQKGVDIALEALARYLAEPAAGAPAQLLICGDGPETESLRRLAERLQVSHRVHFLGKLKRAGLAQALSAADVFLFPTRRKEGLPLGFLEALANGLTAITVPNAQVPHELRGEVTIANTPTDIARAWAITTRSSGSRIPGMYTHAAAMRSYESLLRSLS